MNTPAVSLEFQSLAELMKEWTGVLIQPDTRGMTLLSCRLAPLMESLGLSDLREYHRVLRSSHERSPEREAFVNALSIHTTSFFRHAYQFEYLKKAYLEQAAARGPFRVWSAAASTGAEAYSIALTLESASASPHYRILATDIAASVLHQGESGIYRERECLGLSPAQLQQFGKELRTPDGSRAWQVSRAIRDRIVWATLNLTTFESRKVRDLDAIFCRNVLIYFDAPTIQRVLESLVSSLKPGGLLILGSSEGGLLQSAHWEGRFERLDGAIFRKREVC